MAGHAPMPHAPAIVSRATPSNHCEGVARETKTELYICDSTLLNASCQEVNRLVVVIGARSCRDKASASTS